MDSGKLVFVSYTHEDRERVRPFVDLLKSRLQPIGASIFWDPDLRAGAPISAAIQELLHQAAAVLVVWTHNSVASQWVHSECQDAFEDGRLVPIRLDGDANIPPPFKALNHIDFSSDPSDDSAEVQVLWPSIRDLVERGGGAGRTHGALANNPWVIQSARDASAQLRQLTGQFRSINEVLVTNSRPVEDLRQALKQVTDTYRSVTKAVQRFTLAALQPGALDPQPYVELAHGNLEEEIEAGLGHCGRILIHYRRLGGVRDSIKDRLSTEQLREVDDTFEQLGTADGNAFQQMAQIGGYLREESRVILNNLSSRQSNVARARIAKARELIEPLENELTAAMKETRQLEASLGHAI